MSPAYIELIKPVIAAVVPPGTPITRAHDDRIYLKTAGPLQIRIIPVVSKPRPLTRAKLNWGFKYAIVVQKITPTDADVDTVIQMCEDICLALFGKDFGDGVVWEEVEMTECYAREHIIQGRLFTGVIMLSVKKMV